MKSHTYEQRLKTYKQQKYQLLLTKQKLIDSNMDVEKKQDLMNTIDETLNLIDGAINACIRIVEYSQGIESEIKGYQIIEQKLSEILFENNFATASTEMNINKLNQVGEHLQHLEQLLKYKK